MSIVYALSGEHRFLDRVNTELLGLCRFSDWNPDHFLDVAEMAYAISIGLDWALGDLPDTTRRFVRTALLEKAIEPSLKKEYNDWVDVENNWNQVCHGGITAAAICIADEFARFIIKLHQFAIFLKIYLRFS